MPPVRQSSRNPKAVLPYQAADGPKLTLQQLRRQRARYQQATENRKKEAQKKEQLEKVLLSIIRKKKEEENNEEATEIQTTENELTVVLSVPGVPKKLKLTYVIDSAMSQEIHEIATKAIKN
jgi:hypothetical protein